MDYHRGAREHPLEKTPDDRIWQPDAPVRVGVADRPRLVRAVDANRPSLRPARQYVRERRDADRGRPVRTARIGRDEALVDVEASFGGWSTRRADCDARAEHRPAVAEERQPPRRDVHDDPRVDLRERDGARGYPAHAPVRADRQLDPVPRRAAGTAEQ